MSTLQTNILTDTWVVGSWDEYIQMIQSPIYDKARGYYYNGRMRIEMTPLGNDHACDHSIINYAVHLYAAIKGIDLSGRDACSYRKAGYSEVQPDLSYYVGENSNVIPWGTSIIDLDQYTPPNLVIEIANTSLSDDLGEKRLMYENLGIDEYWIVDVKNVQIIAFAVEKQGSRRVNASQVLPSLEIELLKAALQLTRQMNHGKVSAWLLKQFQDSR